MAYLRMLIDCLSSRIEAVPTERTRLHWYVHACTAQQMYSIMEYSAIYITRSAKGYRFSVDCDAMHSKHVPVQQISLSSDTYAKIYMCA